MGNDGLEIGRLEFCFEAFQKWRKKSQVIEWDGFRENFAVMKGRATSPQSVRKIVPSTKFSIGNCGICSQGNGLPLAIQFSPVRASLSMPATAFTIS